MSTFYKHPERAARMADLMKDLSQEELMKTALQAVDHAYGVAVELEAHRVPTEHLKHQITQLENENNELNVCLTNIERSISYRLGRLLTLPFRFVRKVFGG